MVDKVAKGFHIQGAHLNRTISPQVLASKKYQIVVQCMNESHI